MRAILCAFLLAWSFSIDSVGPTSGDIRTVTYSIYDDAGKPVLSKTVGRFPAGDDHDAIVQWLTSRTKQLRDARLPPAPVTPPAPTPKVVVP